MVDGEREWLDQKVKKTGGSRERETKRCFDLRGGSQILHQKSIRRKQRKVRARIGMERCRKFTVV